MSCDKVNIVKGETRNFFVRIIESCTNDSFDLTALTAVKAIFKGATANVELTLLASEIVVVSPAVNGRLELIMSAVKSALLKTGDAQTFELELTFGADVRIIKIEKLFSVEDRL